MQQYVDFRKRDVELGHIVSGRLATIATHLQHWLSFIGKDTKLKELERTDCENYFYHRQKSTDSKVKQVTVQNEQSTNCYQSHHASKAVTQSTNKLISV